MAILIVNLLHRIQGYMTSVDQLKGKELRKPLL